MHIIDSFHFSHVQKSYSYVQHHSISKDIKEFFATLQILAKIFCISELELNKLRIEIQNNVLLVGTLGGSSSSSTFSLLPSFDVS